tara:strand:+ start:1212 stop:2162 length:951 start_codon:yes stop_codon:yes gene_type:complete
MELQTKVPLSDLNFQIDYRDQILLLGSCFSDHMGALFAKHQFKTLSNPFGIVFHPIPLASLVQRMVFKHYFTEDAFFFYEAQWHSYELHSSMSRTVLSDALRNANEVIDLGHDFLKKASHVFVTLGTAWGYTLNHTTVTNCHKQRSDLFRKELASVSAIENALAQIQNTLAQINPDLKVVYTVSPVRHLKDGFTENSIGKAHLLAGIHSHKEKAKDSKTVSYFPSYEIVMDELRDYRFYKMDLIHPNELAIAYIWESLVTSTFTPPTKEVLKEVVSIQNGLDHRPSNPTAEAHKKLLHTLGARMAKIKLQYPHMFP